MGAMTQDVMGAGEVPDITWGVRETLCLARDLDYRGQPGTEREGFPGRRKSM